MIVWQLVLGPLCCYSHSAVAYYRAIALVSRCLSSISNFLLKKKNKPKKFSFDCACVSVCVRIVFVHYFKLYDITDGYIFLIHSEYSVGIDLNANNSNVNLLRCAISNWERVSQHTPSPQYTDQGPNEFSVRWKRLRVHTRIPQGTQVNLTIYASVSCVRKVVQLAKWNRSSSQNKGRERQREIK